MRSKLFVPASRPELFPKAMASAADAISFDLEDAVLPEHKDRARQQLYELFQDHEYQQSKKAQGKIVIVRINALDTPYAQKDLQAICHEGVDIINVPKINTAEDALTSIDWILRARQNNDCQTGIKVLANIETPVALHNATAIALAHPDIWGLQLGLGDMFEPLNIARYNVHNVHAIMFSLRMAAASSGAMVYDGAYANVSDPDGFRAEALMAKSLGYLGKTCIHPSQVSIANEVFNPSEQEIEWSAKVVQAAQKNRVNGAFLLEGKMIDAPFVLRAQAILDTAARLGITSPQTERRSTTQP